MLKKLIIALIALGGNSLLAEDQNLIVEAAKEQDLSSLRILLDSGEDVNAADSDGSTAVSYTHLTLPTILLV